MPPFRPLTVIEPRLEERLRVLRIGHALRPLESPELASPPPADGSDQILVGVIDEIEERCELTVLFAHEQERRIGREERARGRQLELLEAHERRQPVALSPVAHLVVVLRAHHHPIRSDADRRPPVPALAEARARAGEDVPLPKGLLQVAQGPEVTVVTLPLPGEKGVERVMEVVVPERVQTVAPFFRITQDPWIVAVVLGDEMDRAALSVGFVPHRPSQLLQEREGARVDDPVDRVQAQGVDMELRDPDRARSR
ncbi:MAG: hypothetical protein U5R14_14865 [Gemmatimonadota bacterium]|nr:hypothetical protein [Gemmatimonadota bacterium]